MNDDRGRVRILGALFLVALLAACAGSQPPPTGGVEAPRFLLGVWHGLIAPITFFVSLFNEQVRMYAFPNAGRWYDFGFMIGIGGFSGGLFAGSRKSVTGR